MAEEQWLKFSEAIKLICSRNKIGAGQAQAIVWRAVASREVTCSFTPQAVAGAEKRASQELRQSAERSANARGFKLSGSELDVLRSRSGQAAFDRAKRRLLQQTEVDLAELKEGLVGGNVTMSAEDLLIWLDRHAAPPPATQPPIAQSNGSGDAGQESDGAKSQLARKAAIAIWGEAVPPADLPQQQVFRLVANKVGELAPGVTIGKSQVLRALGLKKA